MAGKTRYPDRFGHADYLTFFLEIKNYKEREVAAGTWPTHLGADLQTLYDNLKNALVDYTQKRKYRIEKASTALDDATKPLYKRILSLVEALPTLFDGDKTVLAEFGIGGDVPSDRDDLFIMATSCVDHWNALCTPDPPPVYAPVVPFFADLLVKFPGFCDARLAYINALRDEEDAQDLVLATREACHHVERLIFHWYSALWLDPEDENWTHTPWGTSSGGGGAQPVVVFPAKPTGFDGEVTELDDIRLWWLKYAGAKVNLYRADGNIGGPALERPAVAFMTGIINESFTDTNLQNNRVYYYWICAVVEGVEGEFAGPVVIEYKKGEDIPR